MPSVTLVKAGEPNLVVDATWELVAAVYGQGYSPAAGTFRENYDVLQGGPLPPGNLIPQYVVPFSEDWSSGTIDTTTKWIPHYLSPTIVNGKLRLPITPGYEGADTRQGLPFDNSAFSVEMSLNATVVNAEAYMGVYENQGHWFQIDIYSTGADGGGRVLSCSKWTPNRTTLHGVAFDPVAHKFVRIRESNGTVYFEASPDQETWALLTSHSNIFRPLNSVQGYIGGGRWSGARQGGYTEGDNIRGVRPV